MHGLTDLENNAGVLDFVEALGRNHQRIAANLKVRENIVAILPGFGGLGCSSVRADSLHFRSRNHRARGIKNHTVELSVVDCLPECHTLQQERETRCDPCG